MQFTIDRCLRFPSLISVASAVETAGQLNLFCTYFTKTGKGIATEMLKKISEVRLVSEML